jgi:uncharacterized coiled-coil protein SlyX
MSAVADEKKRINAEVPMNLYRDVEAAGYKITEAIIKGFEKLLESPSGESDCEQIKHEMENRILEAESRTEARDRQISELSSWIVEKDNLIINQKASILKLSTPKRKTWPNYIAGIRTFNLGLYLVSFSFGMLTMSIIFYTVL